VQTTGAHSKRRSSRHAKRFEAKERPATSFLIRVEGCSALRESRAAVRCLELYPVCTYWVLGVLERDVSVISLLRLLRICPLNISADRRVNNPGWMVVSVLAVFERLFPPSPAGTRRRWICIIGVIATKCARDLRILRRCLRGSANTPEDEIAEIAESLFFLTRRSKSFSGDKRCNLQCG